MFVMLLIACLPAAFWVIYKCGYKRGTSDTEDDYRHRIYRVPRPRLRRVK